MSFGSYVSAPISQRALEHQANASTVEAETTGSFNTTDHGSAAGNTDNERGRQRRSHRKSRCFVESSREKGPRSVTDKMDPSNPAKYTEETFSNRLEEVKIECGVWVA